MQVKEGAFRAKAASLATHLGRGVYLGTGGPSAIYLAVELKRAWLPPETASKSWKHS